MDTILGERKMSIQPRTFAFSHWTDEWLEIQKVNDIQSHRTNKWPTTIWTHLLLEINVFFQGTLSRWLLQVSAAPWYFSHPFPGRPWSPCWKAWAASSELRILDPFPQPSALSSDHGPREATWPENLPPHDKDEVETWTLFILSYQFCWYNKAKVILQRHDVYICLLRGGTHAQSAAIHHC